jgi:hypothetical protein
MEARLDLRRRTLAAGAVLLAVPCLVSAAPQDYPKVSPFSALRWRDSVSEASVPEVEVERTWYELVAIDGVPSQKLVDFCKRSYGERWAKRFGEDLVQALSEMGSAPGLDVKLDLKDLATGKAVTLDRVRMTRENRERIRRGASLLSRSQAEEDLAELRKLLEERYSYLTRRGVDYRTELDEILRRVGQAQPPDAFAVEVQKLLARFGDGHAGVEDLTRHLPPGYLPFLVADAKGGVVAFQSDRSGFVDEERPFLKAIDGAGVERWIETAARIVPQGSPAFVRRNAVRNLRFVAFLRQELKLAAKVALEIEVAAEGGRNPRKLELRVSSRYPVYGEWPRGESRVLQGNIGYLRLAEMRGDAEFFERVAGEMERLRNTKGLVIDVRGNGGGSRQPLRALFPYFMKTDDRPHVANVAAYRLGPGEERGRKEGYLENRFLFPATASVWKLAERAAITAAAKRFKPAWAPPPRDFSDWHYLVLSPSAARAGAPFFYSRPVVVLMNADCFSATDIFLAAFKGWRGVTLLGEASGGGSGRAETYRLARSGLEIRLSTMASFLPDGRLIDGAGIPPDVPLETLPADWIGRGDSQLDAAVARLK